MAEGMHWRPLPFDEAINISTSEMRRRRLRRQLHALYAFVMTLVIAAIAIAGFPYVLQWRTSLRTAQTADESTQRVEGWPYPQAEEAFAAAKRYNKKIAASGQTVLGEAEDPFAGTAGGSRASGKDSLASKDKEYQSLLDSGDGVMGTIRVPKVSIKLPIYHGTSDTALASGAGHLYGTSLPVGGTSSHAVITGHRGLVEAAMFTRLDEMRKGDFFYIEVMGETLGYEVDRIDVIEPSDTGKLRVVKGEDRVTLMTCTPYGVNTHRLLVSGHRVTIPVPAPDPNTMHDPVWMGICAALGIFVPGWLFFFVLGRRRNPQPRIMRHAVVHL
ncbi:class C sortase [Bifidobacterium moukalabense]|uniref:class C sortase n=1 Tax=Bifidobacterium moukalabense TaxID=1333651 RepID=UPI0010F71E5D|nr:class C sortase [Bifidobacterium moukalabense]